MILTNISISFLFLLILSKLMNSLIINLKKIPLIKYLELLLYIPINLLFDKLNIGESIALFEFILHEQNKFDFVI